MVTICNNGLDSFFYDKKITTKKKRWNMKKLVKLLVMASLFFVTTGMIPPKIQFALFDKVFQHDHILQNKQNIRIMMVYISKSTQLMEFEKYFNKNKYQLDLVHRDQVDEKIDEYDVIFILPELEESATPCSEKKKLSISFVPQYAQKGHVAIAIGLIDDTPRVFINLDRLEQEGHTVSASLLQIAEVYK